MDYTYWSDRVEKLEKRIEIELESNLRLCDEKAEIEAQNAKLREAIQKHLDKCKGIDPKLYVFFGFGELNKALKGTESHGEPLK